uniref:DUF4365 domain-containing protein n=2 Tax=Pectobacterium carotovorum TaxID=554 RepID=A0A0K0MPH2_PECCA|nr:hypothetical protein pA_00068 [Pectobacterium carotovorum]
MVSGNKLNLGKLGEDTFSLWCVQAELVSNRSIDEDATGWDHLVEFPYIETEKPKDSWKAPIECKVQVKSTQRKDRRLSIKSSVLKRLIDYSYPAFILFLEFDKQKNLENSFLVHIDENIISKVLKEIRKNHFDKKPKELHKLKISINYGEDNKLSDNTGIHFRESVLNFVPNSDINEYQKNKINIIKNTGYDDFNFQIKFNASQDEIKKLIYQSIFRGEESVTINNLIISENRFNLPDGEQILHNFESAHMVMKPSDERKCNLYFKSSKYSPAIIFNVDVFTLPNLDNHEDFYLILRSYAFSIIFNASRNDSEKITLKLIQDEYASISELLKLLKALQLIENNANFVLGFDFKKYHQFSSRFINSNINKNIASIIQPLECIVNSFNLDVGYESTLNYLAENYATILAISKIIKNDHSKTVLTNKSIHDKSIKYISVPCIKYVEFKEKIIGVSCIVQAEKTNDFEFTALEFTNIDPFIFENRTELDLYIQMLNEKIENKITE